MEDGESTYQTRFLTLMQRHLVVATGFRLGVSPVAKHTAVRIDLRHRLDWFTIALRPKFTHVTRFYQFQTKRMSTRCNDVAEFLFFVEKKSGPWGQQLKWHSVAINWTGGEIIQMCNFTILVQLRT